MGFREKQAKVPTEDITKAIADVLRERRAVKPNELDKHRKIEEDIIRHLKHYQGIIDSLHDKPTTPENNKILEEAQIYLEQLLEDAPELFKEQDSISRKLMEELEDAIIKGRGGRPAGVTKYDDRNAEIKLMYNTLLYGAYYDDTNLSQYKHQNDARDKRDLSVWEIYYAIAEYYPDLTPVAIKDIVNKKTI